MKKIKWLVAFLIVANLLLGVIGCKDPEIHIHTYSEAWTSDEENHWHEATCEHTTEVSGKEAHTFGDWTTTKEATEEAEGSKERVCDVCKYKETAEIAQLKHKHVAGESWKNDDKNHWKECTGCKEKLESAEHEYEWTKDASGHWYECVCGSKKDFEEHTYDIWKVVQKPTDTQAGRNERTCKDCAYIDSVVLQPAPEGFVSVKGATVTGALPAWLDESASDGYKGVFIKDRTVTLSDFYMGKYEVTREEYASVMAGQKVTVNGTEYALESNPSYCTKDNAWDCTLFSGDVEEKRPVEEVPWYDAVWYCNALSEKEGLTKAYNIEVTRVEQASEKKGYHIFSATVTLNKDATGYRLPTEAEWEYAARGGDQTKDDWNYVFSGADTAAGVSYESYKNAGLDSVGWYCYNNRTGISGDYSETSHATGRGTHQVGKKAPNRLGLYDMSGNVSEWCYDWYGTVDNETPVDGTASGSYRVYRGGCWSGNAKASVCYRYIDYSIAIGFYHNLGFRVVRQAN